MKAPWESAFTRLRQQFTPRRHKHETVFIEPQSGLQPPIAESRFDQVAGREPIAVAGSRGSVGACDGATTSTREAMRRQETAELFDDVNAAAETFARAHRRSLGLDQRGEHVAHLIATVSRCIFGEHWDISAAIQSAMGLDSNAIGDEFGELVDKSNLLRKRLRQSVSLVVDDAARSGSQLDPARQMPWKSSLPNAPIRFVVFPGLSHRGHVVVKQQVYTISLREARKQEQLG